MGATTEDEALMAARSGAYRHLREVTARGGPFCDVFSFREGWREPNKPPGAVSW